MASVDRQYFKSPAVDMQKVHADAQYWMDKGDYATVHDHTHTEPCNTNCKNYWPERGEDAAGDSTSEDRSDSQGL